MTEGFPALANENSGFGDGSRARDRCRPADPRAGTAESGAGDGRHFRRSSRSRRAGRGNRRAARPHRETRAGDRVGEDPGRRIRQRGEARAGRLARPRTGRASGPMGLRRTWSSATTPTPISTCIGSPLERFEEDLVAGEEVTKSLLSPSQHAPPVFSPPVPPHRPLARDAQVARRVPGRPRLPDRSRHSGHLRLDLRARVRPGETARRSRRRAENSGGLCPVHAGEGRVLRAPIGPALLPRDPPDPPRARQRSERRPLLRYSSRRLRARGYAFCSLDRALEDPAYGSADTFTGAGGISWLHRWALTSGGRQAILPGEPATPRFVMDAAGVSEE